MTALIGEGEAYTLSTEDWIDVARRVLIRDGVAAVKIDRLARECRVTRGGFYWRFRNRDDLLDKLLDDWRTNNSSAFFEAARGPGSPADRLRSIVRLWIEEEAFSPEFDTAIRNWAQSSPRVAQLVRRVDDERIAALSEIFEEAGYKKEEAFIRARITYFHQVGYYALEIKESKSRRRELSELYLEVLMGPKLYG